MKKILSAILVLLLVSVYPLYNLAGIVTEAENGQTETADGMALLGAYSSADVKSVENKIASLKQKNTLRYGASEKEIKAALKKVDSGKTTYRKLFKNVYIMGDSLMNGLEIYNILNPDRLITQVSASFTHFDENYKKIVSVNPKVLIVHYGINMIGTTDNHRKSFISNYTKRVKKLKKDLPDTRIIISGLFPVDRKIAKAERFKNIGSYNKALKSMCKELKVEFLDSSSVLKAHPECYGVDGIHLNKTFYSKYWLRFIVKEKGIVG